MNLDQLLNKLSDRGWEPGLTRESYEHILDCGFYTKNFLIACVTTELALDLHPFTLRGLFYSVVSAGWLPSTDITHYNTMKKITKKLREGGVIPFNWFVDGVRNSIKPSSWSGLQDYVETVRDAYRKDFWAGLPHYVHVICEKNSISGTLEPVTNEFDVRLSPIRGFNSLTFTHEIAELWNSIDKPIFVYYLGDHDPSGYDLERDLIAKLQQYCDKTVFSWDEGDEDYLSRNFEWTQSYPATNAIFFQRLGVLPEDFEKFNLLPLKAKKSDPRCKSFVERYGEQCAELEALSANELRHRVREAIESHVPKDQWNKLQEIERLEKESFESFLEKMKA